jgi:hypothetical protein
MSGGPHPASNDDEDAVPGRGRIGVQGRWLFCAVRGLVPDVWRTLLVTTVIVVVVVPS